MDRVAGGWKQLVRPWQRCWRAEAWTQLQLLGAGWLAPKSRPSWQARLRLPVMRLEALLTLPDGVLCLPGDTVGIFFFFFCDITSLLWRVDRALIKASSSCFSMTLRQGRVSVESVLFTAAATVSLSCSQH